MNADLHKSGPDSLYSNGTPNGNPDKTALESLYIGMKGVACRAVLLTFRATHGLPPDPDLVAAPGVPHRADGMTEIGEFAFQTRDSRRCQVVTAKGTIDGQPARVMCGSKGGEFWRVEVKVGPYCWQSVLEPIR